MANTNRVPDLDKPKPAESAEADAKIEAARVAAQAEANRKNADAANKQADDAKAEADRLVGVADGAKQHADDLATRKVVTETVPSIAGLATRKFRVGCPAGGFATLNVDARDEMHARELYKAEMGVWQFAHPVEIFMPE